MIATTTPPGAPPSHRGNAEPAADFEPELRPPLTVLPDRYRSPRYRRRRAQLAAVAGILLACAMLFGLAGVHVLLTQGAFRLAHYQTKADAEQIRYIELRQKVAELEAPGRIAAAAQKMGLVLSPTPTYLLAIAPFTGSSTRPESSVAPAPVSGRVSGRDAPLSLKEWALAKPALPVHP